MYRPSPIRYGRPLEQLAATASARSTPLSRSNTTGSPVSASTAVMSTVRCGQLWLGRRAATVARHCACHEPSDSASMSRAAAPILRRMSAISPLEAMILLILSRWSVTGLFGTRPRSDPTGPGRCWGAAPRVAASSSAGVAPAIWAAAVEPAEVPMVRSAVVTSSPASSRPAMMPISHALPVDPPPPRTSARSRCGSRRRKCVHGSRLSLSAWRALPVRLAQSRDRGRRGRTHCGWFVHGSHLLPTDHDQRRR